MKHLATLLLLFVCASSADAAAVDWKLRSSKLIATENRQLGRKSGKKFFGRESKSSKSKASRSRQSSKSAKASVSKSAKALFANNGDIDRVKEGALSDGATPPPQSPLPTGVPGPENSSEETATKFFEVEDNGDYRGLRTQNMIVVGTALFAILAAIVGVSIKQKRAAKSEPDKSSILDSIAITPVVAAARPNRPTPPRNNAVAPSPVDDTDYSCDLFGFNDCLA
eukprot:scaffold6624_cov160-Skeletonema_menzelii.AAC.2